MPLISVGLPVYNGERYVGKAIESVLAQTFPDFELVICDNGSTDGTERICRDYVANDGRIRYFRNATNVGAAANFSRVFEISTGQYFRWLSADDLIAPTALERCLNALESDRKAALACGKAAFIDAQGKILGPYDAVQSLEHDSPVDRFRAVMQQDPQCHAVYGLIPKDILKRTRLLGPFAGSDNTLLAELALYGRFVEVPELLFFRRLHPGAYSWVMSDDDVHAFYAPGAPRTAGLRVWAWRHRIENARAIIRAKLTLAQRASLLAYVARLAWWQRAQLRQELLAALR
jgi:glycosyltransferase involved in cell wall biosynthesis